MKTKGNSWVCVQAFVCLRWVGKCGRQVLEKVYTINGWDEPKKFGGHRMKNGQKRSRTWENAI